jgi:hypothetical protein
VTEPVRGHETIEISAPPEVVWDLVADVRNMGRFSPETVACEWVDGATGPVAGARFRGRNRHRVVRWSTTPEGREFSFRRPGPDGWTTWRYTFEPTDVGGTRLRESWEQERVPHAFIRVSLALLLRGRDIGVAARTTLENIKRAAEA